MALTAEQITQYEAQRVSAEKAYHDMMVGGAVSVFVDQNGERIEYRAGKSAVLLAYINYLRSLLGLDPFFVQQTVMRPMGILM